MRETFAAKRNMLRNMLCEGFSPSIAARPLLIMAADHRSADRQFGRPASRQRAVDALQWRRCAPEADRRDERSLFPYLFLFLSRSFGSLRVALAFASCGGAANDRLAEQPV